MEDSSFRRGSSSGPGGGGERGSKRHRSERDRYSDSDRHRDRRHYRHRDHDRDRRHSSCGRDSRYAVDQGRDRRHHDYKRGGEDERGREREARHPKLKEEDERKRRIRREPEEKKKRATSSGCGRLDGDFDVSSTGTVSVIGAPTAAPLQGATPQKPPETPSECLMLKNVFNLFEEDNKYYLDIRDDIHEKCLEYGAAVHDVQVAKNGGSVYVKFDSIRSATCAQEGFHGSLYMENQIRAEFVKTGTYHSKYPNKVRC